MSTLLHKKVQLKTISVYRCLLNILGIRIVEMRQPYIHQYRNAHCGDEMFLNTRLEIPSVMIRWSYEQHLLNLLNKLTQVKLNRHLSSIVSKLVLTYSTVEFMYWEWNPLICTVEVSILLRYQLYIKMFPRYLAPPPCPYLSITAKCLPSNLQPEWYGHRWCMLLIKLQLMDNCC